jgi:hypothetical protein
MMRFSQGGVRIFTKGKSETLILTDLADSLFIRISRTRLLVSLRFTSEFGSQARLVVRFQKAINFEFLNQLFQRLLFLGRAEDRARSFTSFRMTAHACSHDADDGVAPFGDHFPSVLYGVVTSSVRPLAPRHPSASHSARQRAGRVRVREMAERQPASS